MPKSKKKTIGGRYFIPKTKKKEKSWKGQGIIDKRYWIASILAKRRSGKTVLIYNLIRKFAHKNMIILFFVSTWYNDDTYREIEKYLQKHNIEYLPQTSIYKEDGTDSILEFIREQEHMRELEIELEDGDAPVTPEELEMRGQNPLLAYISPATAKKHCKPKKKVKVKPPEYMIIMDDLSHELRNRSISLLSKNSRHYRIKLILSSQDIKDLMPATHEQIDICFLFKNTTHKRLEYLHERLSLWDSFEHFHDIYHRVTDKPYGFLMIDRNLMHYRDGLFKVIKKNM